MDYFNKISFMYLQGTKAIVVEMCSHILEFKAGSSSKRVFLQHGRRCCHVIR